MIQEIIMFFLKVACPQSRVHNIAVLNVACPQSRLGSVSVSLLGNPLSSKTNVFDTLRKRPLIPPSILHNHIQGDPKRIFTPLSTMCKKTSGFPYLITQEPHFFI